MTKRRDLPKYCYARGNKIWIRFQDETGKWRDESTGYDLSQVDSAKRYRDAKMRGCAARREVGDENGDPLVMTYGKRWVKEREERDIGSAVEERSRLDKYVYPRIGHMKLTEVRPRDARDFVRYLKALKDDTGNPRLAPRTIIHIFRMLHSVFESALVEELIQTNPIILQPGELPKKLDADREWRLNATFELDEVVALIADARLPPERRVERALKALAGMRHGEVAALCVRHLIWTRDPMPGIQIVQAYSSRNKIVKRTKSGQEREAPMIPPLKSILKSWLDDHWPRIYGRKPALDDFVIPTRNFTCVDATDSNEAFKRDMSILGFRLEAGSTRDRGGHDLRSWFITRCNEDDADSGIIQRITHAPPKTVIGGYNRPPWNVLCREASKLNVHISDDDPLPLAADSLQREKNVAARWTSMATPTGFEPANTSDLSARFSPISVGKLDMERSRARIDAHGFAANPLQSGDVPVRRSDSAMRTLERALKHGDIELARSIVKRLREKR